MGLNWKTFAFVAMVGFGAFQYWQTAPVKVPDGAGRLAPEDPVQSAMDGEAPRFDQGDYRLTALARYDITARVLSVEPYRFGREADLSPVDFALGWGAMSDSKVLADISISQSNRFYSWRVESFPIPREEIESHSANTHLIPADTYVRKRIKSVRPGEVVHLRGYLVEVQANDGWRWRSSLSRADTGGGACELMWVESAEVL